MKDSENIVKENKLIAYQLLNQSNLKRSIFLEGIIILEMIMDNIISTYFFCRQLENKIEISEKAIEFDKFILSDFKYGRKVDILKKCGVISEEKVKELIEIGEMRNTAAHSIDIKIDTDVATWIKGKKQKELIRIDETYIKEFKEKFSECYAYLMLKLLSLYNPHKDYFKIE